MTDLVAVPMHRNHSLPSSPSAVICPRACRSLKRMRAVSGQTVCSSNLVITVDGVNCRRSAGS